MIVHFIIQLIVCILCIITMICFHESGHLYYLNKYNYKKHFVYFKKKDLVCEYDNLKKEKRNIMITTGIAFGLVPLLIFAFIIPINYSAVISLVYIYCCKSDIKEMLKKD